MVNSTAPAALADPANAAKEINRSPFVMLVFALILFYGILLVNEIVVERTSSKRQHELA
jgi:hypothetical protein